MKSLVRKLAKLFKKEDGQGMVEYGLIIGLVSVALIAALVIFAPQIAKVFKSAGDALASASPSL